MLLIRYSLSLLFFSFIVLFSGCGGGGSSSVVITPTVTSNFVDDPVENLNFTCSSGTTGITDKSGKYSCCVGDSVIFTLGATTLGPIDTRTGMVTPYDVFPTNIRAAVNLATLLQSLDNNTTDSIISLDNNLLSMLGVIDFTLAPSDFKTAVEAMLNKSLIDDTLARTNMDASIRANGGTPPTLGNHIPVATTTSLDAIQDTNLTGFLAGIDIDGDSVITYIKVSDPSHGTLNINADGSFSYMPDASYNGLDSFSYKVNDGTVDSVAVSVTIHILDVANGTVPVNDS
ncbi:MAG: hypothetical protein GXO30_08655, partial [Epsilonproteobacteria bacterium]|nr:hypothetical protein [Campylobacterota bacterium]